ncbi:biotin-dependent carboxyltransferase family protein [Colwelliaceae bacterium MEBiC 14330]
MMTSKQVSLGFIVNSPGVLSLIQDAGRYGCFNLGLSNGGPADAQAFYWANRLCNNALDASAIEVSVGGLQLTAQIDCTIAVTGAPMLLTVNGQAKPLWRSFKVKAGDNICLGYASLGVRCYVAVTGGFDIEASFGSTATLCRENIGGLSGDKLQVHDVLPINTPSNNTKHVQQLLAEQDQPQYANHLMLRTVQSYQYQQFSTVERSLFYANEYQVSQHWDRMGYRLEGRAIKADIEGILSEGICYGAVQVPADGQPIVLLNDRQTIGGYPKIGAVISQDCAKLSQLRQGDSVHFQAITMSEADNLFHLNLARLQAIKLIPCD